MENSILLELDKVEWKPIEEMWGTKGVTIPKSGALVAIIRQSEDSPSITTLLKLPAGWNDQSLHYHQKEEESVVLQGDLSFFGVRYDAPAYYAFPALVVHGHASSENGCIILMRHEGGIEQTMVEECVA